MPLITKRNLKRSNKLMMAGEISQEEYDMAQTALQANELVLREGRGQVLTGAASGAAVGAAVGSVVPIVGTFIGGLVGGIVGQVQEFGDDLGTKAACEMDSAGGSQQLLDEIALKSGYVQDAEELLQTLWKQLLRNN